MVNEAKLIPETPHHVSVFEQYQHRCKLNRPKHKSPVSVVTFFSLAFLTLLILYTQQEQISITQIIWSPSSGVLETQSVEVQDSLEQDTTASTLPLGVSPTTRNISNLPTPVGVLVNSSECVITAYDPWDSSLAPVIDAEEPFKGCQKLFPVRIEQTENTLIMLPGKQPVMVRKCVMECCVRTLIRASDGESDDKYTFIGGETCFDGRREIEYKAEFVRVRCFCRHFRHATIHEDYRVFFVEKENSSTRSVGTERTVISSKPSGPRLDLHMFGLDSVSWLNFRRYMPKLERMMATDYDAIPMLGLTKVGVNTFPNMVALLTGRGMEQINQPLRSKPFDKLPFIWQFFSALNYTTMFNEDMAESASFNFKKMGFFKQPCDYYMRPLNVALEESPLLNIRKTLCINQRTQINIQVDWLEAFLNQTTNKRLFSLLFSSYLSHDGPLNYVKELEPRLVRFFKWYKNTERYNTSILVFFSDHGQRFGPVMRYELGGYESRLPFFYFVLPPWYKKVFPQRVEHLRANSHRLSTFFDVHATLRQLVYDAGAAALPWMNNHAISLFEPIPVERSCQNAGIAEHWCVCNRRSPMAIDDSVILKAAEASVVHINEVKLKAVAPLCAILRLAYVTTAFKHRDAKQQDEKDTGVSRESFREYAVSFVTQPGQAEFESTVRSYKDGLELLVLDVSRLNVYKGQSDCLTRHFDEKRFCYCHDLVQ